MNPWIQQNYIVWEGIRLKCLWCCSVSSSLCWPNWPAEEHTNPDSARLSFIWRLSHTDCLMGILTPRRNAENEPWCHLWNLLLIYSKTGFWSNLVHSQANGHVSVLWEKPMQIHLELPHFRHGTLICLTHAAKRIQILYFIIWQKCNSLYNPQVQLLMLGCCH